MALETLRAALASRAPGPNNVERELVVAWDFLEGAGEGGMRAWKLAGRTIGMTWQPPFLTFDIERHGAIVVGGSGYAEIQSWEVNVAAGIARIVSTRKRRVRPMQSRVDVDDIAAGLAAAVARLTDDPRLRWSRDMERFQVRTATTLPQASKQTTAGRVKRLAAALDHHLGPLGWVRGTNGWWLRGGGDDAQA